MSKGNLPSTKSKPQPVSVQWPENVSQANSAPRRPVANCDQEVWVRERILSAIRMAIFIRQEARVRADHDLVRCAIQGVANGAAIEIIHTLGMDPSFTNLSEVPDLGI